MDDVTDLTCALVAIDSVNPGLVPGAAGEREIVEHLRARLDAAGLATHVVEAAEPGRPSLLAWTRTPNAHTTIALTGHLDTVGVEGMDGAFEPRVSDDGTRLTGRGSCDMLGGIAAIVVAAERAQAADLPVQVVLALAADEEDASLGTTALIPALADLDLAPEAVLVAEPTWLALTETLRGYAVVEVELRGRATHSSTPAEGVDALDHLARLLSRLRQEHERVAPLGGSWMCTQVSGGSSTFVVAEHARLTLERRTVPHEDADVEAEVRSMLDDVRTEAPDLDADWRIPLRQDAWRADTDGPAHRLAQTLAARLADRGHAPAPFAAPYWMEAPLWQAAGIPAVICGPAGGGLHAADEWLDLSALRDYTDALTDTLTELAGGPHAH